LHHIKFKNGVDASGVHPHLWYHLGIIGFQHYLVTHHTMVITSLRRPYNPGKRPSKHRPKPGVLVTAGDIRRWYLDDMGAHCTEEFCLWIKEHMGRELGVVLEPEWADYGGAPHMHIQSKKSRLYYRLSEL